MPVARILSSAFLLAILLVTEIPPADAAEGDPVAIRRWPGDTASVETHWGLELRVLPSGNRGVHSNHPKRRDVSFGTAIDHELARKPNQDAATWKAVGGESVTEKADEQAADPNLMRVSSLSEGGGQSEALLARVDGVSTVFLSESVGDASTIAPQRDAEPIDVVVLSAGVQLPLSQKLAQWIKSTKPRFILIDSETEDRAVEQLGDQLGASDGVTRVAHNTFAVSQSDVRDHSTRLVILKSESWKMPDELESMFSAMETSCLQSQGVFEKLSANQMSFRPSNGTHTPRWNAEHMMGRQLLFFSQIYHSLDPAIPVMDLNPKQMPPDYSAAHPEWDGKEESRQMNRVSGFTRRFAYLLQDVDPSGKVPGSRWTLRGLLRQMERHYDEHTANTIKKFELPDWPKK